MDASWNQTGKSALPGAGVLLLARDIVQKPLNYDKYSDLESELNTANLADFIQKIAQKYKGELTANLQQLQKEKALLDGIVKDIQEAVSTKESKLKRVIQQRENDEKRVGALKKEIGNLQEKIVQKKVTLKEKEPAFKKFCETVDAAKREITPELLKKVFNFLEHKSAEPIAFLMEALIGLLRGMRRADTQSVKLYVSKHEGFMIGVNRVDLKKLNAEHCKEHLDLLQKEYNAQILSEEFEIFHPFRNLLVQMIFTGLTQQDLYKYESKISEYENKIHLHQREIEKIEMMLKSIAVEDMIKEDYGAFKGDQTQVFIERRNHVEEEIKKTQSKLQNFETNFFAGL